VTTHSREVFWLSCNQCGKTGPDPTRSYPAPDVAAADARATGWHVADADGYHLALCPKCSQLPNCSACEAKGYELRSNGVDSQRDPQPCDICNGTGRITACGPSCRRAQMGPNEPFCTLTREYCEGRMCRDWRPR